MSADEVVVDASLALKWVEREPYSDQASELLQSWHKERRRLTAPTLFAYEATNALLTVEIAKERLASLLENGPALEHDVALNLRALEIMQQFSLPSAYDAHYLALAEFRQCECWTADERLWNTVKSRLPWVRWIGQHAVPVRS